MSRQTKKSRRSPRTSAEVKRIRTVWVALLAAMTVVGGGLLLIDDRAIAAPQGGLTLPAAAVMATGSTGLEALFERTAVTPGRWKAIVIHHSASSTGSGKSLDAEARQAGLPGLGHHFVIGNGRGGMEAGEIHVGYRWTVQNPGVHTSGANADWYNQNAISICLVGDGDRKSFDGKQLQRTADLIKALCRELQIPQQNVKLHRDVATTNDPGRTFPEAWLREEIAR